MRASLAIACRLPPAIAARAAAEFYTIIRGETEGLAAFLAGPAARAEALLCAPGIGLDADMVDLLPPSLRIVGSFSAGLDHLDLTALAAKNIAVVNTPGVLSAATAEIAVLLMLAACRRVGEGERLLRAQKWRGWTPDGPLLGTTLAGKILGIWGMGRIGQAVCPVAQALGMKVIYRNRRRLAAELEQGASYADTETGFLAASNLLLLAAPGGAETRHWLNAARLARLPRGAVVVNIARGSLIDDAALIAALDAGQVAAAGLDVFVDEPHVPAGYLARENLVLLPHLGSAATQTRDAMGNLVLDGIAACLRGERPPNLVLLS